MQPAKAVSGFRDDINGLRAWAVVAVLLFHFKVPGFGAGFIGVDIFFVISGFLMTGIILRGLEQDNFSLWQFYMARARRIVPALMLLIAVLLALGWFWLPTPDYQTLGSQSAYSLGFLSNIHYWRSAGYFDSAAHEKWLLHTWSLGIEMQFYLLYPVFALLVWKLKSGVKTFTWSLLVVFVLSLALSVMTSSWRPTAAFYLLPTRGWELAAGGLVYLLGRSSPVWLVSKQRLLYWTGWVLWLTAFVLVDSSLAWPSGWALLPVAGTALIILANQQQQLMVNPLAQWLGNISYSLYLWHWPLVVALYFADLQQQWGWVIGGLLLSLLLGQLSYRLVENPVRHGLTRRSYTQQVLVLGVAGLVIGVSAVGVRLFVFEGRLPAAVQIAAAEALNKDPRAAECAPKNSFSSPACIYGSQKAGAVLLGDSHAMSLATSLGTVLNEKEEGALFLGKSGCITIAGLRRPTGDCYEYNTWLMNDKMPELQEEGLPVFMVGRASAYALGRNEERSPKPIAYFDEPLSDLADPVFLEKYRTSYIETACKIQGFNQVYLLRPIPEMGIHVPNTLVRNQMFGRGGDDIKISLTEYHERHAFIWEAQDQAAEQCGVKILDPLPYLCDDQYCYGLRDGRPLYYDDDHLSEYGNKFLIPMFEQVFADMEQQP